MPRQSSLNYDPTRNKWVSVYKGKKFRCDAGSGKSDRQAKKIATEKWNAWKTEIAGLALKNRPHQQDYERAVEQWQNVLGVARDHDLAWLIDHAETVLTELHQEMAQPVLEEFYEGRLFLPPVPLDLASDDEVALYGNCNAATGADLSLDYQEQIELARRNDRLWRERLAAHERRAGAVEPKDTVAENIREFLQHKRDEAESGHITAGRADKLRTHLEIVSEYAGPAKRLDEIDGAFLAGFRQLLLKRKAAGKYSANYAKDVLGTMKQFVKWLYHTAERLENLPRNIDSPQLTISAEAKTAEILTTEQLSQIFKKSTERTQLYALLGLNCGMTQIDISDLHPSEVDWSVGKITRKRSKTSKIKSVPTVTYQLWPQTFNLLKKYRSSSTDHVLLTRDGLPLLGEEIKPDGKLRKRDSVRLAIRHLSKQTEIEFTMKHFKKTSASLIRDESRFSSLEHLFLGHAPSNMADRHYTTTPQNLLDEALEWLGKELGIAKALNNGKQHD